MFKKGLLEYGISIHTLHTEGDRLRKVVIIWQKHFNPHPPHGG